LIPGFEINFTNKPCAIVFDQGGNWDIFSIRLLQRRLWVLADYGVVCHITKGFAKRFKGKKATWFYDVARTFGSGRPFDPQRPLSMEEVFTKMEERKRKMREKHQEPEQTEPIMTAPVDTDQNPNTPPVRVPLTRKQQKELEKRIQQFESAEEAEKWVQAQGIEIIDPIPMESDLYADDGGFDDEEVIFNYSEQLLQVNKSAKDSLSSKPVKPTIKIVVIMGAVVIVMIVLIASPQIINSLSSIKLPALPFDFGQFLLGTKLFFSSLLHFS